MIGTWNGEPVDENTPKEILLEIINYLAQELQKTTEDKARWMRAADVGKYLLDRSE